VYLTIHESRAVSCVEGISRPLAVRFARAFTEHEPEVRGLELLKILREVPADPASDREATIAYFIASSAMQALPDLPETKAAKEELALLHGCRFDVRRLACPTRPPIPMSVWLTGVPSAITFVVAAFVLGREGVRRLLERRRARKAAKARRADDPAKPDEAKPDEAKPDEAKPDEAKPDEAPEEAEPSNDRKKTLKSADDDDPAAG
jgi:hypothetical protein